MYLCRVCKHTWEGSRKRARRRRWRHERVSDVTAAAAAADPSDRRIFTLTRRMAFTARGEDAGGMQRLKFTTSHLYPLPVYRSNAFPRRYTHNLPSPPVFSVVGFRDLCLALVRLAFGFGPGNAAFRRVKDVWTTGFFFLTSHTGAVFG